MARLPNTGGDSNSWGTLLNDYLQQALASDGKLVTAATNPYTGTTNTNLSTSSLPGLVQLIGDLGNTATSPTVTGIQGRSVSTAAPNNGEALVWNNTTSKWTPTVVSGGSADITRAQTMAINSMRI